MNLKTQQDPTFDPLKEIVGQRLKELVPNQCQRILLIHPQYVPEDAFVVDMALRNRYWAHEPYGCGVLASNLTAYGYEADILDLNYEMLAAAHNDPENFVYQSWEQMLKDRLEKFKPDIIGISTMFTMSHGIMKSIAQTAKKICPTVPIFAGGVYVSNARELVLEDCPEIDFIGLYECDRSFPDLVEFINGNLPAQSLTQVALMYEGKYLAVKQRATPSPREIEATPMYYNLPIGNYNEVGQIGSYWFLRHGRKAASVLSNRGCRAHCSFCSVISFNGPGIRTRSVVSVADEIETLARKYNVRHVTWLDDDLLFDKKRTVALFEEITARKLDLTWDASNGLIAAAITAEIMDAMVASGCIGFNLGIESGSPEILRAVHKPGTVDTFRKTKQLLEKYPQVFVKGFLMVGFPHETLRQILETVNLALELNFDWYPIQVLNPLPSTEIYKYMIEQGLIQDGLETGSVAGWKPHGRQRLREEREKLTATEFFNLFNVCDLDEIPAPEQLGDYWFLMDYKVNYEKILGITDQQKLLKIGGMLEDVCERIAPDNPMAHLFQAVIEKRTGNDVEAGRRLQITKQILDDSAYWRMRFETLELFGLMNSFII